MRRAGIALALALGGCPPVPGDVDGTYEQGVAEGYAAALQQIEALTASLADLQTQVDDLDTRLSVGESQLGAVATDVESLLEDALLRGDVAFYPNETESTAKSYQKIGEGAWVPVALRETTCRLVYLKVRIDMSAISPTAFRDVWYAVDDEAPSLGVYAPYGGVGSLTHVEVDADKTPDITASVYTWVDLEGADSVFLLLTPDVGLAGNADVDLRVAHLGCIK